MSEVEDRSVEDSTDLSVILKDDEEDVIRAAGCLVYREVDREEYGSGPAGQGGGWEVLVVHRPLYDDWDFPKGKREDGESDLDCAVRETEEESGYGGEVERELSADHYLVKGRDKVVRWWLMRCTKGSFVANVEVDEVRWLPPDEAKAILSYGHARSLIDEWLEPPANET